MKIHFKNWVLVLFISVLSLFSTSRTQAAEDIDQKVLSKLHHGNQSEIQMAQLALKYGESSDVRSYAGRIIRDHTDADKKVLELAQADKIVLTPIRENMMDMKQLESLSGPGFDKAYTEMMVKDHRQDIAELSQAIPLLKHENARELGKQLLVTFQHHEELAAQMESSQSKSPSA